MKCDKLHTNHFKHLKKVDLMPEIVCVGCDLLQMDFFLCTFFCNERRTYVKYGSNAITVAVNFVLHISIDVSFYLFFFVCLSTPKTHQRHNEPLQCKTSTIHACTLPLKPFEKTTKSNTVVFFLENEKA